MYAFISYFLLPVALSRMLSLWTAKTTRIPSTHRSVYMCHSGYVPHLLFDVIIYDIIIYI